MLTLVSMESNHLVIFSTSCKFITKFNVLRCISLSETLFWTGARGRIPITLINKFVACGPKIKYLNVFKLSRGFSKNTFFAKQDLRNGYFHVRIYPPHRTYFGFSSERQYYVFIVL